MCCASEGSKNWEDLTNGSWIKSYKWTWYHTLIQNFKAQVYEFYPHLHGVQSSHSISTWCVTSCHPCTPSISPSSVNLFQMVVSPSNKIHFQSMNIQ